MYSRLFNFVESWHLMASSVNLLRIAVNCFPIQKCEIPFPGNFLFRYVVYLASAILFPVVTRDSECILCSVMCRCFVVFAFCK
jgi:hypothetical protein